MIVFDLFLCYSIKVECWCSSVVELLICNQPVAGSNPVSSLLLL